MSSERYRGASVLFSAGVQALHHGLRSTSAITARRAPLAGGRRSPALIAWRSRGGQREGTALRIPTDGPPLPGMNHRAAVLTDALECHAQIGDSEVRKGGGISRTGPPLMDAEAEAVGLGFPPGSGPGGSWREVYAQHFPPEAVSTRGVVGGELDQVCGHEREYGRSAARCPRRPLLAPPSAILRTEQSWLSRSARGRCERPLRARCRRSPSAHETPSGRRLRALRSRPSSRDHAAGWSPEGTCADHSFRAR